MTKLLVISLAFLSLGAGAALAQSVAIAEISGVVRDPTGAVVPNAQIKAVQTATGLVRTTASGSDGSYVLPELPIGPYSITVTSSGFKSYVQSGLELHVGDRTQINVSLEMGSATQQVEVSADVSLVETNKTSVSQVIDQKRIVDLPLNGRQATQLVVLAGAAQSVPSGISGQFDLAGSKLPPNEVPISVAGGQANGNNWLLDGADHNDSFANVNLPYPFPDALEEFEVETNTRSARSGVHPGAVINVVTKSGSNQFHGNLFEFLRNGDVNARNFFAASHDTLKRNQFGGTVGGPLRKDKLFFFAGYQGTRNRTAPPASISFVPTPDVLAGNFGPLESAACQSTAKSRSITDPLTKQPFPNNVIPVSRFNQQSLNLLKYVPISSNPCGKVVYGIPSTGDDDQVIFRIDYIHSQKHTLFGRGFLMDYRNPTVFDGSNLLPSQRSGLLDLNESLALGDVYTFSATTVNSLHLNATRFRIHRGPPDNYIGDKTVGINISGATTPNILSETISGYFSTGGPGAPLKVVNDSYQLADDVDLIRGRHHISLGGEYFRNQINEANVYTSNGGFNFNGQITGDALADFMLGRLSSYQQSTTEGQNWRQSVLGLYAEDEIHLTPRLLLTAGLRWEPFFPTPDKYGRGDHFDATAFAQGKTTSKYQFAPPGLLFAGDAGITKGYTNTRYNTFEPRLGIVWDPTGKGTQTIRTSYGIFDDTMMLYYYDRFGSTPPSGALVTVNNPTGGPADPWTGVPGGNPFPLPFPPSSTFQFPLAAAYITLPLNLHPTYVQQWNFSYQRQLSADWVVSATYLGNKTTHLWLGEELNPAVYTPGTCGTGPCSTIANTNQRRVLYLKNPTAGAYYSTIGQTDDGANAEYNGLIVSLKKRFSQNFTILSNYTYSHCISTGDFQGELIGPLYQNPANRNADRGNCAFDHRQIFNTSGVLASPKFSAPWAERILGNWQLSPILTASSGTWFTLYTGVDNSLTGIGLDRPNVVLPASYPANQTPNQWFNPSAFAANALGSFGNSGRSALLGPKAVNLDFSLSRNFALGEQRHLEARAEIFNSLNHPNFATPTNTSTQPTFGAILSAADPRIFQFVLKLFF
jgi:carboxypeptidase family protein/TonB-dependent receptor-like protein